MPWRSAIRSQSAWSPQGDTPDALAPKHVSWTLWSRYIVAVLSIVAVILTHHVVSLSALADGAQDEELLNLSGQQRMLSQRILFLAKRYVEKGEARDVEALRDAVELFETSHAALVQAAGREPAVADIYGVGMSTGLDARSTAFARIAASIAANNATPAVTQMRVDTLARMGRDSLLEELDVAVSGFEAAAQARTQVLRNVQHVALVVALAVLLLEFLFIFRPLNRWVVQTMRQLDRDANYDALTGLENRRRFAEGLQRLIETRPDECSVVVIALDLDGFKAVNDVLGHPAGDEVLRHVAAILKEETAVIPTAAPPLVSRLGGDEFFVCFTAATEVAVPAAEAFGAALIARVKDPLRITLEDGEEQCLVGVSLGFVTLRTHDAVIDTVLADADIALYASKRAGKGRMTRFRPDMRAAAISRLRRETELRRGLMDGEFEPYLMPQVDMETGGFVGFEALARWRHPVHGILGPAAFLPDAEDTNMVNAIEGSVIFKTIDVLAQMNGDGLNVPMVSINVSERSLRDVDFVDNLAGICAMFGVPPSLVTVEILETLTTEGRKEQPLQTILNLGRRGFRTAIDDFGTGYSSLAAVSSLDVQYLKVDRSLVRQLGEARVEKVLVATIAMAKGMGVKVVAEGVETQHAFDALRAMGCDCAQGHLVGKAMPVAEAMDWLRRRRIAETLPRTQQKPA
jgi:diguanylate cyclase (GGDEF)-like protein